MTEHPSTDDTGGGVATHFFARLMRLTGVSLSSAAAAAAASSNSLPQPTTSTSTASQAIMTTESPTTTAAAAAAELAPSYLIDRVTQVARIALEVTTSASEVLAEGLPEVDTSFANATTLHGNLTLAAAAATNYENCSAIFANYTQPESGIYCNFTWDTLTCWPPTPAGVMARMHCPAGFHGVDPRKFAIRKCEMDGSWGTRPDTTNMTAEAIAAGWTDYGPCYRPEVIRLMQQMGSKDIDLYIEIARHTRTLEIVGLCLSLIALLVSLVIFCSFRSLRNNRTRIHKNLFVAMVLQVLIRLTIYLDQFQRGSKSSGSSSNSSSTSSLSAIENTPYLCEASYVLLEYARTAMFMWMFIEGLYLHNMVTVAVFQGQFPLKFFSRLGWCVPILMTTVWARCTVMYMDTSMGECLWNYNLTPYYWILEGPRLAVILLNFCFLVNIIRVLVMKLRQSQASDIEQTRKAVRAAIVLLPLLGITNLLHQWPVLKSATNFAVWSYGTHFLTSFQGFFIALIYCFLNGEVRACLLKSLSNQLSLRGHPEWAPKRASMYSGAYNTAPDTDAVGQQAVADSQTATATRTSPVNRRQNTRASIVMIHEPNHRQCLVQRNHNNNNNNSQESPRRQRGEQTDEEDRIGIAAGAGVESEVVVVRGSGGAAAVGRKRETRIHAGTKWMMAGLCFRGQKDKRVMFNAPHVAQQIFMKSQLPATTMALAIATVNTAPAVEEAFTETAPTAVTITAIYTHTSTASPVAAEVHTAPGTPEATIKLSIISEARTKRTPRHLHANTA
ncbi:PDF receptor [Drosophila madeirensis]|uniref:PDF receptor n=1 Tax=Drosophila madeirensis TaxID=30013 RepID=A0AAU9FW52_DROMD